MSIRAEKNTELKHEGGNRVTGMGEGVQVTLSEEEQMGAGLDGGDRAIAQFSRGSLYAETNQFGTQSKQFHLQPDVAAVSSAFAFPHALSTTKHPIQDFWVYDGAHPALAATGKIATSRDQILPDRRIMEQDAVEYQRVGAKKGWMFNGSPQQEGPGPSKGGENFPTHTSDGFIQSTPKWFPTPRDAQKQIAALRETPAVDITNNARGIGVTGGGSGNGGMAGGYKEVNPERLKTLPIPMAKYNWTGTRLVGTGREDQGGGGLGSGAGGYRAGYGAMYPTRPVYPQRRTTGLARVTQNAA